MKKLLQKMVINENEKALESIIFSKNQLLLKIEEKEKKYLFIEIIFINIIKIIKKIFYF